MTTTLSNLQKISLLTKHTLSLLKLDCEYRIEIHQGSIPEYYRFCLIDLGNNTYLSKEYNLYHLNSSANIYGAIKEILWCLLEEIRDPYLDYQRELNANLY